MSEEYEDDGEFELEVERVFGGEKGEKLKEIKYQRMRRRAHSAEFLAQLPSDIASKSISSREIVLPKKEALLVVNLAESNGFQLLGWEGWVRDDAGRIGHGSAPQGTQSLECLPEADAAKFCQKTIEEESASWEERNVDSNDELFFCITVCAK